MRETPGTSGVCHVGSNGESMTSARRPRSGVLEAMREAGDAATLVYGLTGFYGPVGVCAWRRECESLGIEAKAAMKAREGVNYPVLEGLMVADAETLEPVPRDGRTLGEVFMRGNVVMKGYLKNPRATDRKSTRLNSSH